jgi:hypothetical protein
MRPGGQSKAAGRSSHTGLCDFGNIPYTVPGEFGNKEKKGSDKRYELSRFPE